MTDSKFNQRVYQPMCSVSTNGATFSAIDVSLSALLQEISLFDRFPEPATRNCPQSGQVRSHVWLHEY